MLSKPVTSSSSNSTISLPQAVGVTTRKVIKVPKTIYDVDSGRTVGFGADLADDHPVGKTRCVACAAVMVTSGMGISG